jgi:hypothetical protein
MSDKDIIFITAYKDINRNNWEHYSASNDYYINYFYNLANNIKYKLIVYLEDDIRNQITNSNKFNDNIIFENLNEVDTFYDKYLENDIKIINSDIYRKKIPEWRCHSPEHLYSEYNLINHSKINFVRHTRELYSDYKFYAWIDFGRMNCDIDNIPKNLNISLIPENKITYHFVNNVPSSRKNEDEMLTTHEVFILGSSFIVPTDLVIPFEKLFEDKLIEWQEKYITDDDQNLVLQIYFDNPELFNQLKHNKWYGMYEKLQYKEDNIKFIPKIFVQTSKHKPEQYVIDNICSKCPSYQYLHFNDEEIIQFFKENYIEEFKNVIEKFNSLENGAHKADLFRYYFLYLNGGVYMDSDMMIEMNIDKLLEDNLFVSILGSHHQCGELIVNAFIGVNPKNDIIYKALIDAYNIDNNSLKSFYHTLCRNLFIIYNNNKRNIKTNLFKEEKWENVMRRGYDFSNTYNENNEVVLRHYCIDKKIPKI